jgi:hypothetical protein
MTLQRDQSNVACEDCGRRVEATAGWSKPSGTAGHARPFAQPVQRADFVLGHRGYLCTPCWWARRLNRELAA